MWQNKIFMAADPYCEFTKSIGAEIDRTEKGSRNAIEPDIQCWLKIML